MDDRIEQNMIEAMIKNFAQVSAGILIIVVALACSEKPERTLSTVLELHERNQFAESIPILEGLIDASPDDRVLNRLYGIALLSIGQPVPAIWPLERAAAEPDGSLEDGLLLGQAHLQGGGADDARAIADRLIERAPDLLEAYRLRIEANQKLEKHENALADLDFILDHLPNDPSALLNRAHALLMLELTEEAEEAIADARETLTASDAAQAWRGRFCMLDATFTFEKGEDDHIERASEIWKGCLDEFPTDPNVVSSAVKFFDGQHDRDTSMQAIQRAVDEAPRNVDFRLALAPRLEAIGQHEAAVEQLKMATEQPGGLRAWGQLVESHSERGEWPEARAAFEAYLERLPNPSEQDRLMYADFLIRAKDFDAAEKAIEDVTAPEFVNLLKGRLLVDQRKPRKALEHLEKGIRLWPDNSVARQLAAEAWEQLGNYEKALPEYVEAARVDQNNWEVMQRLATLLEAKGETTPLVQLLNRHVSANRGDLRAHRMLIEIAVWSRQPGILTGSFATLADIPGHAEWAIAKRATLIGLAKPKAAITFIDESDLDLTDPQSGDALAVYVETQSRLGRHDEALERSRAALATHEDFARFHEIHAKALAAAGKPPGEIQQALERAVEIAPRRATALAALGDQAAQAGKIDGALVLYDRASAAAPQDPEFAWSAIQLLASRVKEDPAEDDTQSIADIDARLERLLARHGYHAGAATLLARRITALGVDLERARRLAQRAVTFGGGSEALSTLGWINLERGDPKAAIEPLRRSLQLVPDSPTTHFHLGRALAQTGDQDGARAELKAALASDGFPEQSEARAELARLGS